MTAATDRPQPRRWLQFSITALLVLTTICAILFSWWRDRTQLQQRLEIEVRRAAMERDKAVEAEAMSRVAEMMAHQHAAEAQAALREATSQPTVGSPGTESKSDQ